MAPDSMYTDSPRSNDESGYDANDEASPYLRVGTFESFDASPYLRVGTFESFDASPYLGIGTFESFDALNFWDSVNVFGVPKDHADDGLLQLSPASPITEASEVLSVASTAKIHSGSTSQSHSSASSGATMVPSVFRQPSCPYLSPKPTHSRSNSQILRNSRSGDLIAADKNRSKRLQKEARRSNPVRDGCLDVPGNRWPRPSPHVSRPGRPVQLKHENGFDTSGSLAVVVEGGEDVGGMADFSGQIAPISNKQKNVISMLCTILKTVEMYRCLLSCGAADAQKILDGFQLLLDTESFPDRGQLIAAMRRLSERTQRYPSRFLLQGPSPSVEAEPVTYGSFADIYKIVSGGQELCYKVIRVYQKTQVEHLARVYAREAILWGQLSHPNILPFYGLLKFRSRIAFVSCWASNGNLEDYLTEHPEANRILLCSDTAAGVEYLHRNDIVHGDLKGLNVLIDSSGRASLGDFGVSSVTDPQILRWTSQSTVASKGGTIRWQAPELLGSEDTTKKIRNSKASDVFAWASVCYEIFTGCLPFHEATNHATVVLNTARGDIPSCPPDGDPAWTKHGLNNRIWQLMRDCWNFEPERRPDIATVIFRLSAEKPVDLRSPGEWEKAAMRFRIAQDEALAKDLQPFWEEMESLLSRVVPSISGE